MCIRDRFVHVEVDGSGRRREICRGLLMYVPRHFRMSIDEARSALTHVRLADLITVDPETLTPVLTPVPFVYDPTVGTLGAFQGHVARPNTQWSHTAHPALVVLRGEDAYVTPDWYPSYRAGKETVPTWNYEVVQATGQLVTHTEPEWLLSLIHISEPTRPY